MNTNRYVVYEYNENASPNYIGCRFMTQWTKPVGDVSKRNLIIIAENVSSDDADYLVKLKSERNIESYLINSLPKKLILVRTGNVSNTDLIAIFKQHLEKISYLMEVNSLIEITKFEIVVHGQ